MIQDVAPVDGIREVFRRELSSPEYVVVEESVLARLARSGWEWLVEFFRFVFPEGVPTAPAAWVPWLLVGVAGVASLLFLKTFRGRGSSPGATLRRPGIGDAPSGAREWEAWADARAEAGEYREAATGYYQAALKRLDEQGAVEFGEWKTPGDYLEELDPAYGGRADFSAFVSDFVSTTFASGGAGPDAVRRLAGRLRSLGSNS